MASKSMLIVLVVMPGCATLRSGPAVGVGDVDRWTSGAAQSGLANFAIENEMSVMLAVILLAVLVLMGFDKLLAWSLQRMRIRNDGRQAASCGLTMDENND